ncbi:MAG: hypothetical protein JWR69_4439 [Pedosphaera sp.]|nr:hypothetical protein [Pedosphaera sp.]
MQPPHPTQRLAHHGLQINKAMLPRINPIGNPRKKRLASFITRLALCAGSVLTAHLAQAQAPVNLIKFAFDDSAGTTTASDTSLGGVNFSLAMVTGGNVASNYHGAIGSGVSGALNGNRALDFSSQTNQPGGSNPGAGTTGNGPVASITNSTTLGFGTVTSFVATVWIKQNAQMALSGGNVNIGPRIFILNAGAPVDSGGSANGIGLKFQAANQLYFQLGTDTVTVGPVFTGNVATNKWLFIAIVYDGVTAKFYSGSDTAASQLLGTAASAGRAINFGASASLAIGNRGGGQARNRSFDGWVDDFRFYTNAGDASFVESVRQEAVGGAPTVTGVYPDGLTLQQGTNTLSFTASSPSGAWGPSVAITNVQVVLNGVDVSSQLVTSGPATNLSVTYSGLKLNQLTNTALITVQDAKGLLGNAAVTFDTFSSTNFSWEAEEFDFTPDGVLGGQYLDNPVYSSSPLTNSYFGFDSIEGIDTHKGAGNPAVNATDYRAGAADASRTQTAQAVGELQRPKILDAIAAGDAGVVDHIVGNWGSADWENYTKTFPAGNYNIYGRLSAGAGAATIHLDKVTSGQGTVTQTLSPLGTFTPTGSSYTTYQWAPLRDSFGNLASVNLAGVNTVRVTTGGGANANFYMLVPANTNLPSITGVYPDGLVLFESTNKFVFTASSATTTISTNSIQLTLNGTNVSTNLVFSGSPASWNVSYTGLLPSQSYVAVMTVTDANGNTAASTLNIDTYNPLLVWEAEDFDFNSGFFIDNPVPTTGPAANSYYGLVGSEAIDEHATPPYAGGSANNYRPADHIATTLVTDAARQQFLTAGAPDYNIGFLGNGYWQNYTKTFPTGTFNIYTRAARGDAGAVSIFLDQITSGWGAANQLLKRVGTFTLPGGGGWSAYKYVPLIDRFGNYANVVLNGTNTFRTTESIPVNVNFYMLTAARTDLPRIDSVYPDGSQLRQGTNVLSFVASSPTYGINTTNIHVTLNGVNISSSLVFSGSSLSWNVSYPGLLPSTNYTAIISVTDLHGVAATTTVTFDTFNPANFTWEAEDFDFGDGQFLDNPAPTSTDAANSYFNRMSDWLVDQDYVTYSGTHLYRPSDYIATEVTSDSARQRYIDAQQLNLDPAIADYDLFNWTTNSWINYTRTYPSGNFRVYARLAGGNGAFNLQLAQVTSGWGTSTQTTQYLGTFKGTGTSFTTWQWVPLVDTNTSQAVVLSLGGTNTFRMTADGNENANFYMLVPLAAPVSLTATPSGSNILVSFPTVAGFSYTVSYKNQLSDPNWTPLSTVAGNGSVKSVSDGLTQASRFYRLSIQ